MFGERNCYFNTTGISLCGYFGFRINLNPIGKIEFYCVEELSLTKDKRALHLEEVTVSQDHDPWSLVLCPAVPRASFQVACLLQDLEYTDTITKTWTLMTWFSLFGWELRNHHSLPPLSFCDGTFGWWSVSHSVALGSAQSFVKLITPDELSNARTLSVCGLSEVSFTLQKISSIKRCYCVLPRNLAILRNILLSTREEMEFNPKNQHCT